MEKERTYLDRKRGQVWVETVIYTLMGLAIIGILLAVSKPKIDSMKDKLVIEQSINSLNSIDEKINNVQIAPGNKRIIELKISKGKFFVNPASNSIYWILDSSYQYSEPDTNVSVGNLKVRTTKAGPWQVKLEINYPIDLKYQGGETVKEFDAASVPYTLTIENIGVQSNNLIIDIRSE